MDKDNKYDNDTCPGISWVTRSGINSSLVAIVNQYRIEGRHRLLNINFIII